MFTKVFSNLLFISIICSSLACASTQVSESELASTQVNEYQINESQISDGPFEIAIKGENEGENSDKLQGTNGSNLNDARFRNLEWGMSLEEVLKAEGLGSVDKVEDIAELGIEYVDEAIYFQDIVGGYQTIVLMYFSKNKLVGGTYVFQEEHHYKNKYIDDFKQIENVLLDKYGPASISEIIWRNKSWKDNPGYYGHAVAMGHLEYKNEWNTANNLIQHSLGGDGLEIDHLIYYFSKQFKSKVEDKGLDKF